MDLFFI